MTSSACSTTSRPRTSSTPPGWSGRARSSAWAWRSTRTGLNAATGTDAVAGKHDVTPGLRYADDAINLPTQAATQWDALSHVFLVDKMWNGYPATLVDMRGAHKNSIDKFANKM
ncbi:MAG: hypothetical protein DME01_02650, partial [Candidatus Rokuibacteriota bacterium]